MEKTQSQLLAEAFTLAFVAHQGQFRKRTKQPFVIHPIRVSEFILKEFPDHKNLATMRIAALLHDVIEDTWITEDLLFRDFGVEVSNLVIGLTVKKGLSKEEKCEEYKKRLENAADELKIIKLADIWDNTYEPFDGIRWKGFVEECKDCLALLEVQDKKTRPKFESLKKELLANLDSHL